MWCFPLLICLFSACGKLLQSEATPLFGHLMVFGFLASLVTQMLGWIVWTISPQHDHTLVKFSPSLRRRGNSPGPQPLHPLVTSINKPRQSFGNSLQLAAFMWNCPDNSRWQTILCFSHWILDSFFVPFCPMLIRCLLLIWWFDTLENYLCMLMVCDEPGKLVRL